MRQNVIKMSV